MDTLTGVHLTIMGTIRTHGVIILSGIIDIIMTITATATILTIMEVITGMVITTVTITNPHITDHGVRLKTTGWLMPILITDVVRLPAVQEQA